MYRDAIDSVALVDTGRGQGTGFMFDESHVVTNAHVVGRATLVQLRFNQGDWTRGEVVGSDPHSDLAVIEARSVPSSASPLPFLDGVPTVGQEVVAIGNPFSLNGSLTTGIVSGTDRLIPAPTGFRIPDAIQTDAAVNPGNSGGPLVSLDGTVVGVVSSKRGDNIAFGISAALTRRVVPALIRNGEYDHAYMGVQYTVVTPTIAAANELAEPRGVIVIRTVPQSPADGRLRESEMRFGDGVRVPVGGDVIIAVDGTSVATTEDLASYLALRARPGDSARLTILRNGTEQTVELQLGTRPDRASGELIR